MTRNDLNQEIIKQALFSIAPLVKKIVPAEMIAQNPFKAHGLVAGADQGLRYGALLGLLSGAVPGLGGEDDGFTPISSGVKGALSGLALGGLGGAAFGHQLSKVPLGVEHSSKIVRGLRNLM